MILGFLSLCVSIFGINEIKKLIFSESYERETENLASLPPSISEDIETNTVSLKIASTNSFSLNLGKAKIEGKSGVLATDIELSISGLSYADLPDLPPHLINVTGEYSGFRMLPHNTLFKSDIEIELPYDEAKIPEGFSVNDIETYYYDEQVQEWKTINYISADTAQKVIISGVNHFTDFINAITQMPEMPETQSFAPTQFSDMQAANPLSSFHFIEPPQANNNGTVNLSFPLSLPSGRQGLQPNLTLNYSSESDLGLFGLGWDLAIPEISIETRWGVPRYDSIKESETYLLNGEQLIQMSGSDYTNLHALTHREEWRDRDLVSGSTQFFRRVEGSFEKIIRYGTNPKNYYWEVTDKHGVKYYYGKQINNDAVDDMAVLKNVDGNIGKWKLTEIRDLNGNFVEFTYKHSDPANLYKEIRPDTIYYTGHGTEHGKYSVGFHYKEIANDKYQKTNARLGFLEANRHLVTDIIIKYDSATIIKQYRFCYEDDNAFGKLLLSKISEVKPSGFCSQNADYYCLDTDTTTIVLQEFSYYGLPDAIFSEPKKINITSDPVASYLLAPPASFESLGQLGGNSEISWGAGLATTLGPNILPKFTKIANAGANYNFSRNTSKGVRTIVDLNGDGLPDRLTRKSNKVYFEALSYNEVENAYNFESPVVINGLKIFSKEVSNNNSFGGEAHFGHTLSGDHSIGNNKTKVYFTDINADGLIDVVNNGYVYYNKLDANGDPSFEVIAPEDMDEQSFAGEICVDAGMGSDGDSFDGIPIIANELDSEILYKEGDTVWTRHCTDKETFTSQDPDNWRSFYDSIIATYPHEITNDKFCWYTYELIPGELKIYPPHDLVKLWIAPYDGDITISNDAVLTDNLMSKRDFSDSLKISIQIKNAIVYDKILTKTDTITSIPSTHLAVNRGDHIYFRVESMDKKRYDKVAWTPQINYTKYGNNTLSTNEQNSLDANGKHIYKFNASEDFLINPNTKYAMPFDGRINIISTRKISEYLSDNVDFIIKKNNIPLFLFADERDIVDETNEISSIPVETGDSIEFRVECLSNVNWQAISWDISLYYDSIAPIDNNLTIAAYDTNFNPPKPNVKFDIIPFFTTYPKPVRPSIFVEQLNYLTNYIDTLKIFSNDEFIGFLSIKGDDGSVQNVFICHQLVGNNYIHPINPAIHTTNGVGYFVDFYTMDTTELGTMMISFGNTGATGYKYVGIHGQHRPEDLKFGNLYNNWGQFNYKNTSTAYTDLIVKDSLCQSAGLRAALAMSNALAETDPEQANEIITNWLETHPYEQEKFLPMSPDYKYNQWVGHGNVSYVNADTLSNTLPCVLGIMPEAEYSLEAMGMPGEDEDDILDDVPQGAVKQAPILKSKSKSKSSNISAFVLIGNGSSSTEVTTTTAFQDMNGDRYPDEISEKEVKYSNPQGGTSNFVKAHNSFDYGSEIKNSSGVIFNYGAAIPSISQIRSFCTDNKIETQGSIGSVGYGESNMDTKSTLSFIDYNGDGLPDKITDDGKVLYNLGYEFAMPINISNFSTKKDFSETDNATLGVNIGGTSIAAGYGLSDSKNNTKIDIIDINGDGLPDKVRNVSDNLKFYFNIGKSFVSNENAIIDGVNSIFKTTNRNNSLNVAVSFGLFGLVVNPKTFMSWGASDVKGMFSDINADGLVDYVYDSDNDEYINVRYNQLGKTNLLKTVTNLVGSEFEISYTLSKHGGFDCPNRTMVMDSLKIFDGYTEDGANYQYFAFEYDSCMYQRFDRENLGFKIVKTKALDQELEAYKIITEHYHNDKVLLKGLKYKDLITDKDGNKYIENEYIYGLCALNNGQYISSSDECRCDAFPALSEQVRKYYETQTEPQIITNESFEYGQYGNITKYTQEGDITDNDDNFTATITYMGYSPQYLVGKQTSVVIKVSGEQTIRKTDYLHNDTTGNLTKITKYNNDITSEFDYAYDVYGNITRVLLPHNATNQRMRYNYIYDNQIFSLPIQISDVYGYTSSATYDYKLQVPLTNTDINGNTITYEYDWRARPIKIISPNETDFTIKYEYSLGNTDTDIAWAKTMHYDVFNEDSTINTILFCDGLGKIIQTKKTMEINGQEKRVVSGKIIYDDYARKIAEYYPKEEAITANDLSINTGNEDNTAPTQYQYDILNRITKTTYPDGTADSIVYDISENKFRTKHIDAMGNIVTSYFDYRNLPTKITNSVGSTILEYDQLGQTLSTTDPDNLQTSYTYDMLGRKTSRTHPDAGLHSYSYDQASNLISIDKNGLQTNYTYEYNRLKEVEYSEYQENKITYTYGNANAGSNQKGRIVAIEDINGWVHFEYDKLGNVSKETKIVILPNEAGIFQFSMLFDYDSWARVKSMQYPDGEIVYYSYDRGGNLKKLSGSKIYTSSSENYPYIKDILYNKFGKRSNIIYGNDIESTYQYDNMLRLSNLQSSSNDETLQILNYQYDYVGNIVAINNTASALANGTGIGGEYSNTYEYDNIYRLTNASNSHSGNGINKTKTTQMQYSPNGRILEKKHITTNNNANPPFLLPSTTGFNNYELSSFTRLFMITCINLW